MEGTKTSTTKQWLGHHAVPNKRSLHDVETRRVAKQAADARRHTQCMMELGLVPASMEAEVFVSSESSESDAPIRVPKKRGRGRPRKSERKRRRKRKQQQQQQTAKKEKNKATHVKLVYTEPGDNSAAHDETPQHPQQFLSNMLCDMRRMNTRGVEHFKRVAQRMIKQHYPPFVSAPFNPCDIGMFASAKHMGDLRIILVHVVEYSPVTNEAVLGLGPSPFLSHAASRARPQEQEAMDAAMRTSSGGLSKEEAASMAEYEVDRLMHRFQGASGGNVFGEVSGREPAREHVRFSDRVVARALRKQRRLQLADQRTNLVQASESYFNRAAESGCTGRTEPRMEPYFTLPSRTVALLPTLSPLATFCLFVEVKNMGTYMDRSRRKMDALELEAEAAKGRFWSNNMHMPRGGRPFLRWNYSTQHMFGSVVRQSLPHVHILAHIHTHMPEPKGMLYGTWMDLAAAYAHCFMRTPLVQLDLPKFDAFDATRAINWTRKTFPMSMWLLHRVNFPPMFWDLCNVGCKPWGLEVAMRGYRNQNDNAIHDALESRMEALPIDGSAGDGKIEEDGAPPRLLRTKKPSTRTPAIHITHGGFDREQAESALRDCQALNMNIAIPSNVYHMALCRRHTLNCTGRPHLAEAVPGVTTHEMEKRIAATGPIAMMKAGPPRRQRARYVDLLERWPGSSMPATDVTSMALYNILLGPHVVEFITRPEARELSTLDRRHNLPRKVHTESSRGRKAFMRYNEMVMRWHNEEGMSANQQATRHRMLRRRNQCMLWGTDIMPQDAQLAKNTRMATGLRKVMADEEYASADSEHSDIDRERVAAGSVALEGDEDLFVLGETCMTPRQNEVVRHMRRAVDRGRVRGDGNLYMLLSGEMKLEDIEQASAAGSVMHGGDCAKAYEIPPILFDTRAQMLSDFIDGGVRLEPSEELADIEEGTLANPLVGDDVGMEPIDLLRKHLPPAVQEFNDAVAQHEANRRVFLRSLDDDDDDEGRGRSATKKKKRRRRKRRRKARRAQQTSSEEEVAESKGGYEVAGSVISSGEWSVYGNADKMGKRGKSANAFDAIEGGEEAHQAAPCIVDVEDERKQGTVKPGGSTRGRSRRRRKHDSTSRVMLDMQLISKRTCKRRVAAERELRRLKNKYRRLYGSDSSDTPTARSKTRSRSRVKRVGLQHRQRRGRSRSRKARRKAKTKAQQARRDVHAKRERARRRERKMFNHLGRRKYRRNTYKKRRKQRGRDGHHVHHEPETRLHKEIHLARLTHEIMDQIGPVYRVGPFGRVQQVGADFLHARPIMEELYADGRLTTDARLKRPSILDLRVLALTARRRAKLRHSIMMTRRKLLTDKIKLPLRLAGMRHRHRVKPRVAHKTPRKPVPPTHSDIESIAGDSVFIGGFRNIARYQDLSDAVSLPSFDGQSTTTRSTAMSVNRLQPTDYALRIRTRVNQDRKALALNANTADVIFSVLPRLHDVMGESDRSVSAARVRSGLKRYAAKLGKALHVNLWDEKDTSVNFASFQMACMLGHANVITDHMAVDRKKEPWKTFYTLFERADPATLTCGEVMNAVFRSAIPEAIQRDPTKCKVFVMAMACMHTGLRNGMMLRRRVAMSRTPIINVGVIEAAVLRILGAHACLGPDTGLQDIQRFLEIGPHPTCALYKAVKAHVIPSTSTSTMQTNMELAHALFWLHAICVPVGLHHRLALPYLSTWIRYARHIDALDPNTISKQLILVPHLSIRAFLVNALCAIDPMLMSSVSVVDMRTFLYKPPKRRSGKWHIAVVDAHCHTARYLADAIREAANSSTAISGLLLMGDPMQRPTFYSVSNNPITDTPQSSVMYSIMCSNPTPPGWNDFFLPAVAQNIEACDKHRLLSPLAASLVDALEPETTITAGATRTSLAGKTAPPIPTEAAERVFDNGRQWFTTNHPTRAVTHLSRGPLDYRWVDAMQKQTKTHTPPAGRVKAPRPLESYVARLSWDKAKARMQKEGMQVPPMPACTARLLRELTPVQKREQNRQLLQLAEECKRNAPTSASAESSDESKAAPDTPGVHVKHQEPRETKSYLRTCYFDASNPGKWTDDFKLVYSTLRMVFPNHFIPIYAPAHFHAMIREAALCSTSPDVRLGRVHVGDYVTTPTRPGSVFRVVRTTSGGKGVYAVKCKPFVGSRQSINEANKEDVAVEEGRRLNSEWAEKTPAAALRVNPSFAFGGITSCLFPTLKQSLAVLNLLSLPEDMFNYRLQFNYKVPMFFIDRIYDSMAEHRAAIVKTRRMQKAAAAKARARRTEAGMFRKLVSRMLFRFKFSKERCRRAVRVMCEMRYGLVEPSHVKNKVGHTMLSPAVEMERFHIYSKDVNRRKAEKRESQHKAERLARHRRKFILMSTEKSLHRQGQPQIKLLPTAGGRGRMAAHKIHIKLRKFDQLWEKHRSAVGGGNGARARHRRKIMRHFARRIARTVYLENKRERSLADHMTKRERKELKRWDRSVRTYTSCVRPNSHEVQHIRRHAKRLKHRLAAELKHGGSDVQCLIPFDLESEVLVDEGAASPLVSSSTDEPPLARTAEGAVDDDEDVSMDGHDSVDIDYSSSGATTLSDGTEDEEMETGEDSDSGATWDSSSGESIRANGRSRFTDLYNDDVRDPEFANRRKKYQYRGYDRNADSDSGDSSFVDSEGDELVMQVPSPASKVPAEAPSPVRTSRDRGVAPTMDSRHEGLPMITYAREEHDLLHGAPSEAYTRFMEDLGVHTLHTTAPEKKKPYKRSDFDPPARTQLSADSDLEDAGYESSDVDSPGDSQDTDIGDREGVDAMEGMKTGPCHPTEDWMPRIPGAMLGAEVGVAAKNTKRMLRRRRRVARMEDMLIGKVHKPGQRNNADLNACVLETNMIDSDTDADSEGSDPFCRAYGIWTRLRARKRWGRVLRPKEMDYVRSFNTKNPVRFDTLIDRKTYRPNEIPAANTRNEAWRALKSAALDMKEAGKPKPATLDRDSDDSTDPKELDARFQQATMDRRAKEQNKVDIRRMIETFERPPLREPPVEPPKMGEEKDLHELPAPRREPRYVRITRPVFDEPGFVIGAGLVHPQTTAQIEQAAEFEINAAKRRYRNETHSAPFRRDKKMSENKNVVFLTTFSVVTVCSPLHGNRDNLAPVGVVFLDPFDPDRHRFLSKYISRITHGLFVFNETQVPFQSMANYKPERGLLVHAMNSLARETKAHALVSMISPGVRAARFNTMVQNAALRGSFKKIRTSTLSMCASQYPYKVRPKKEGWNRTCPPQVYRPRPERFFIEDNAPTQPLTFFTMADAVYDADTFAEEEKDRKAAKHLRVKFDNAAKKAAEDMPKDETGRPLQPYEIGTTEAQRKRVRAAVRIVRKRGLERRTLYKELGEAEWRRRLRIARTKRLTPWMTTHIPEREQKRLDRLVAEQKLKDRCFRHFREMSDHDLSAYLHGRYDTERNEMGDRQRRETYSREDRLLQASVSLPFLDNSLYRFSLLNK